MPKSFLPFLFFLCLSLRTLAIYDVNENCKKAWMLLMNLKIDQAKSLVADEIKRTPENYYAYYLDQTCDVFKLIINSNDKDYKVFLENYEKKRKIMDGKDETSPYYLSCSSEMALQVAVFNVMHGSQFAGIKKGYTAYKDLYSNLKKFPQFRPNRKLDGFFNVAIANLPPFVKWAVSAFGVKVDINYGFQLLFENYQMQKNIPGINAESALYIILAAKINKTPEMLYDFTKTLDTSIARTFVHQYFKANVAYWCGKNEEAIRTLQQSGHNNSEIADIIYSYMMGKMLLRKGDPNAEFYLKKYLSHLEKKEYLKEINYSLALFYLLDGDRENYNKYCEIVRIKGMDLNERDREALYDANLDYPPEINLVKARLSLDGGYLAAFLQAMNAFESSHAKISAYELEWHFLKGRHAALTGNNNLAVAEFRKVIELGENQHYYFACEAALRLGEIYQKLGMKSKAGEYYKKSHKLYKKDYYEYLEDKATKAMSSL